MSPERHAEQRSRRGCGTCKQRRKRCDQDWELIAASASSNDGSSSDAAAQRLTCQACKARQEVCHPPRNSAEAMTQARARVSDSSPRQRRASSPRERGAIPSLPAARESQSIPPSSEAHVSRTASSTLPFFYNLPAGHAPLPLVPGITTAPQPVPANTASPSIAVPSAHELASSQPGNAARWSSGATRVEAQPIISSTPSVTTSAAWPLDFTTSSSAWRSDAPNDIAPFPAHSVPLDLNGVDLASNGNVGQNFNQQQADGWNEFMRTLAAIAADSSATPRSGDSYAHGSTPGSAGLIHNGKSFDPTASVNRVDSQESLLVHTSATSTSAHSAAPPARQSHDRGQERNTPAHIQNLLNKPEPPVRRTAETFTSSHSTQAWPSTCSPPANGGTGESCAPLRPVLASSRLDALLEHYMPIFSKLILIYSADAPWLPRFLEIACTNEMSKASVVAVVAAFHERLFGDPSLDPTSADKRRQGSLKAKDLYPDESGQEVVEEESDDQDDGEEWRSSRLRKRKRRHSQADIESESECDLDASPRSRSPPRPFPVVRLARAAFQQSGLSPHAASPDGAMPNGVGNGQPDGRDRRTMPSEPDRTSSAHLHAAARRRQVQRSEASQMVLSPAPWWQLAYSLLFSPFSHSSPLEVKIMTILNLKCAVLCVEGSMTARRLMDRLPEILSHPAAPDRTEPELLTMDQVTPHMSQDDAMLDVWSRLLVSELMQRASESTLSTCTFPTPDIAFLRTVYWLQDAACPHELPLLMCQSSKLGARRKSKTISGEQAAQEAEKLEAAILEATVTPCQKWTLTQRAAKFWQQEAWRRAAIIHLNTAGLGRGPLYCKVRTALCDILRCNANVPPISVRSIERWYSHSIWIMAGIASVTQQDRTVCLTNLRAVSIEKAHGESALRLQRYWSISDTLGNAPDWFDDQWGGGAAASLILY